MLGQCNYQNDLEDLEVYSKWNLRDFAISVAIYNIRLVPTYTYLPTYYYKDLQRQQANETLKKRIVMGCTKIRFC